MVKITVLSSGSSGNAIVIENSKVGILLDIGLSYNKLNQLLKEASISIEKIGALLITHEHDDHIRGFRSFVRKRDVPIFVSEEIESFLKFPQNIKREINHISEEEEFCFDDFKIIPFSLPHDAKKTYGFIFKVEGFKIGYVCDLGTFTKDIVEKVKGANCLMIEFNHDIDLLCNSSYPEYLKMRIASRIGHLSNEQGAKLLRETFTDETIGVFLMHLSQETNLKEIAEIKALDVIGDRKIFFEVSEHLKPSRSLLL